MKKTVLISSLLAVFLLLPALSFAGSNLALLFPTASEKEHEKIIGKYLEDVEGWKVNYNLKQGNENNLMLRISFNLKNHPSIRIYINSTVYSRHKDTNEVLTNKIRIYAYQRYGIKENHPKRRKVLELINQVIAQKVIPKRLYLDSDGDVVMEEYVFVASKDCPTHAGQIAREIRGLIQGWKYTHDQLLKIGVAMSK